MIGTTRRPQINGGGAINAYGDHRTNNGNGMMRSDTKKRRPDNSGSKLLKTAENQLMFEILGPQRVSLSAAVVELLRASNGKWHHVEVGVISLVKDYNRKLYALLMFNIHNGDQLYEQVLYKNFVAKSYSNCRKLLSFESEDCVYGLNFSDEAEAVDFKHHLDKRREAERDPRDSRSSMKPVVPNAPTPKSQYNQQGYGQKFQSPGFTDIGSTPHIAISQNVTTPAASKKKAKDQKKKKPKITKEDIGYPTNFKHQCHLGWDTDSGFNQQINTNDPLDKSVVDILKAAGHNPALMSKEDLVWAQHFVKQYEESPVPPPVPQPTYPQSTLNRNNQQQQQQRSTGFTMAPINHVPQVRPQPTSQHYQYQQQHSYAVDQSPVPPPAPTRDSSMHVVQQQRQTPVRPPPIIERPPPPMYHEKPTPTYQPPSVVPQAPSMPQNTSMVQVSQQNRPGPAPPPPPMQNAKPAVSVAKVSTNAPPAPPPPPMTMIPNAPPPPSLNTTNNNNKPAPANDRSNLLAEIQGGKKLKHVGEPVEKSGFATGKEPADGRDKMLNDIRTGPQLKHVDADPENRKSVSNVSELGGIAGALARALHERRKNMSSDDSDNEDGNDSEWEDD